MFDLRRNKNTPNEEPEKPASPEPVTPAAQTVTPPAAPPTPIPSTTPSSERSSTVIGPSVKIQGDIISDEDLIIEGEVDGTITANAHTVTVGKNGTLKANISAKDVKIDGTVEGNISGIERVLVTASGVVRGNIVAPRVILEDGARFKGSIDMDAGGQSGRPAATTPASKPQADVANPVQSSIGPKAVGSEASGDDQKARKSTG